MTVLKGLDSFYDFFKDINVKRDFIGSMFPEKLEFDERTYRTARMNIIASYIFQINNGLAQIKTGETIAAITSPIQ